MAQIHKDLFGGTGAVAVSDLIGGADAGAFSAILDCTLEGHGSVGRHQQATDDELVIGLEGEGIARVNDQPVPLRCGAVVWLPLGAVLALKNTGDAPLRYLIVKAPR